MNFATKTDLKDARGVDVWYFAKKTDLGNLKCNVDKLDIDKLKNVLTILINLKRKVDVAKLDIDKSVPVPIDLSKLGDVEKMILLKKMHIMVISKT